MPAKNNHKPIRVGVLGQGRSGLDIHSRWFQRSPGKYQIVAIADALADRRQRAETELKCETYADYRRLLARDDLDLVVNALPSHLHPKVSVEALEAGHHVVCEKPLGWKVSEVDRMIQAAKKARRILAPFQQSRYAPYFQKVKQVIDSGVLGRIVQINVSFNGFARRWDWQTLQEFKGGNLLNTGPHPMDQIVCLLDFKMPDQVLCAFDRANTWGDAEDHVKVVMRGKGQPVIDLEISSCSPYPRDTYVVYGTQGGLSGGAGGMRWRYFDPRRAPKQQLIRPSLPGPSYCREELKFIEKSWQPAKAQQNLFNYMSKCFYDHLYTVLREGAPLHITPHQVRMQIALIEECHRQNKLSRLPVKGWPKGE
ncbi:MAG: Gfo/Idh/MocA family oxidoreductase [Candidatus Latescibacteria bacterium]|nr:Gfo/Idh/MocA family oxidoreductase [Candidatus Latescibacterota bacterium]